MDNFKTKNNMPVHLQCFLLQEDIIKSRLFDSVAIQASINSEVVGYVKISYIGEEKAKKLVEPFDYFIYKMYGSDDKIVEAYENNNYQYILEKLALRDLKTTTQELQELPGLEIYNLYKIFRENINNIYKNQFKSMIEYWVNKPNIELISVFSDKDFNYTDYSKAGYPVIERKNKKNWQGHGIGATLYEKAATWCQEQGLSLWASNTRTDDAKRMWRMMEKYPKFSVIMTNICKYTNSGEVIQIERPKLLVA